MLEDKDRIFQNLYNDLGSDLTSAKKRGDWKQTEKILEKGPDWIVEEIKLSALNDSINIKDKKRKFIQEAENIVKSQKSQSEKANALVILEAIRSLLKTTSPTQFGILGARLDQLIR